MSADKFKWGIIGPGRIANKFADCLVAVQDAELYGVASRDEGRAREFASRYAGRNTYGAYEHLVADSAVDAVYIGTPHRFHYEQTKMCLEAGKPVLCEKPLTVNAREAEELIALAREKNVFLMEALWTRYLPVFDDVRQWLDSGAIGDARLLTSTFGINVPRDYQRRTLNHDLAGGTLLDMGIYNIAVSQWVTQTNPVDFSATGFVGETDVDELTSVNLLYPHNLISQFTCSLRVEASNDFYIYGSKGHIRLHPRFWDCQAAKLTTEDRELVVERPYRRNGFEYQTEAAMRSIREGRIENELMPHADTLATMRLMDLIRAAIGQRYSFE